MNLTFNLIIWLINAMYGTADRAFSVMFFYCDSFLRTLTVSIILILTIGKLLSIRDTKFTTVLKWIIYIWFFGYTIYDLGIFTNLLKLNTLDWSTIAFSILAPLSMLIVGKQITNVRVKGHKIFIYFVIMLLYLVFVLLWYTFYPNSVNSTFALLYWGVALIIVLFCHYFKSK